MSDEKPNIGELMKMAKKMQDDMRNVQEMLEKKQFEGQSGAGMVKATVNGRKYPISTKISEQAHKETKKEELEDLITAAYRDANKRVDDYTETELRKMSESLGLPPDFEGDK